MTLGPIVFFTMEDHSHFESVLPIAAGLSRMGFDAHFFAPRVHEAKIRGAGVHFHDLYAGRPLESADSYSRPIPVRFVTFAGRYAEEISREVAALGAELVVLDTLAVVGCVVASELSLPFVTVCAAHNIHPSVHLPRLATDPRVRIGEECRQAVAHLRDRFGILDASPFHHYATLSPFLNVLCEPPSFMTEEERRRFEPAAHFGSLATLDEAATDDGREDSREAARDDATASRRDDGGRFRIYASFGTVVWRYYTSEALAALEAVAMYGASTPGVEVTIGLGSDELDGTARRRLERHGATVHRHADQWRILRDADLFVTHHGLRSTHEAVYRRVPMLSYPFLADQPFLAKRCEELGLAVPLVERLHAPVSVAEVAAGVAAIERRRDSMLASLESARKSEIETHLQRDSVLRRIAALAAGAPRMAVRS